MRVLFDQGTPAPLRLALGSHAVETAHECGCSALRNGELLQVAEAAGFDVLITTDLNLRYQQNLKERAIAIVVLSTTSWPRIRAVTDLVLTALDQCATDRYLEVKIP